MSKAFLAGLAMGLVLGYLWKRESTSSTIDFNV